MKFGVIGAGNIGSTHGENWHARGLGYRYCVLDTASRASQGTVRTQSPRL
jgi:hypothetical protein